MCTTFALDIFYSKEMSDARNSDIRAVVQILWFAALIILAAVFSD